MSNTACYTVCNLAVRAFSPLGRRRRHCRRRRRHRRHKLASLPSRCHRLWLIIVAVVPLGFESGAISRGDLILIHANDHALSSQSPPSPPPPPPLAPPCHFILPGTATNCSHRRRQVSPPLTARLVFASCRWWRCRFAGADASPHNRPVTTLLPPRRRRGPRHGTTISLGQVPAVPHCILRHIE